jgi:hypothetical protein
MKVKIEITCDNAAFEEEGLDNEVYRILKSLMDRVSQYGVHAADGAIMDINGNKVGKMEVQS